MRQIIILSIVVRRGFTKVFLISMSVSLRLGKFYLNHLHISKHEITFSESDISIAKTLGAYLGSCQTSIMELFKKVVNG